MYAGEPGVQGTDKCRGKSIITIGGGHQTVHAQPLKSFVKGRRIKMVPKILSKTFIRRGFKYKIFPSPGKWEV
jgi:hypothetical protein